ncbi:hypothetical protein CcI49_03195 [Frankia sp. CcI49]|uniref:hypothetical protein n=1 Tax=Frankia sp. CcI49 TaxID=1745382 RepID=UPI00097623C8|nr:hypothetical protein [Frankia sp. CcI49]ONH62399.1 hypothetical protein CcI49_03195 [Frankia sp. CcI49]
MRLGPIGRQIDPIPSSVRFTLSPTADRDAYRAALHIGSAVVGLGASREELAEMIEALGLERSALVHGRGEERAARAGSGPLPPAGDHRRSGGQ